MLPSPTLQRQKMKYNNNLRLFALSLKRKLLFSFLLYFFVYTFMYLQKNYKRFTYEMSIMQRHN